MNLKDKVSCSVCLEVKADQVTLRCGHNFCHECVTCVFCSPEEFGVSACAECRAWIKEQVIQGNEELTGSTSEIFCTFCIHSSVLALKYCQRCEASLCAKHLQVHSKSPEHVLCDVTQKPSTHLQLSTKRDETEKRVQNLEEHKKKVKRQTQELKDDINALFIQLQRQLNEIHERVLQETSRQEETLSHSLSDVIHKLKLEVEELSRKIHHHTMKGGLPEDDFHDRKKVEYGGGEMSRKVHRHTIIGGLPEEDFHDRSKVEGGEGAKSQKIHRHTINGGLPEDDCHNRSKVECGGGELSRKIYRHTSIEGLSEDDFHDHSKVEAEGGELSRKIHHHTVKGGLSEDDFHDCSKVECGGGEMSRKVHRHTIIGGLPEKDFHGRSKVEGQKGAKSHKIHHRTIFGGLPEKGFHDRSKVEAEGGELSRKIHHHTMNGGLPDEVEGGDLDEECLSRMIHEGLFQVMRCVRPVLSTQTVTPLKLDISSAADHILISEDLHTASWSPVSQNPPGTPQQFQYFQVLSSSVFSKGRYYWQVETGGPCWRVGVCYPSIERRGDQSIIGNNDKSWCVCQICDQKIYHMAKHNREDCVFPSSLSCNRVGIYVDYEARRISFYELSLPVRHLHTFTTIFTEPLHAAIYVCGEEQQCPAWVRIID